MNIIETLSRKEKERVKTVHLKIDEILFYEGERCNCIGILGEGSIKISSFAYDGKEIIYNTLKKDGIFGNNLLFSNEPTYKGDVIAKEDTTIYLIYKEDLLFLLQTNRSFLTNYLQIQSDFGKYLNGRIRLLSYDSLKDRLLFFLSQNHGIYHYSSISDLASTLNVSREALSRCIHQLEKEGVLKIKDKAIKTSIYPPAES